MDPAGSAEKSIAFAVTRSRQEPLRMVGVCYSRLGCQKCSKRRLLPFSAETDEINAFLDERSNFVGMPPKPILFQLPPKSVVCGYSTRSHPIFDAEKAEKHDDLSIAFSLHCLLTVSRRRHKQPNPQQFILEGQQTS